MIIQVLPLAELSMLSLGWPAWEMNFDLNVVDSYADFRTESSCLLIPQAVGLHIC